MDTVMHSLKIPGAYVLLKMGDQTIIDTGLGWANIEQKTRVTSQTTFRVASVTKTFTSTLIMQLVQQNLLDLDAKASQFGIDLGNPSITVRHLLSHTSEGAAPGTSYRYNGYRFGLLTQVVEKVTGKPFHAVMTETILLPLNMSYSAPGIAMPQYFRYADTFPAATSNFHNAFINLAAPYSLSGNTALRTEYYVEFGAFGGLVTRAHDLLKYSNAIDQHTLIDELKQQLAWTQVSLSDTSKAPYGLGWFVGSFGPDNYYWHYGQTQGEGALFLKIPNRKLTLIVTSNSDRLSAPFPLGDGDMFSSPVVQLLYKYYIEPLDKSSSDAERKHVKQKELVMRAILAAGRGDTLLVQNMYDEYKRSFAKPQPARKNSLVEFRQVGINVEKAASFTLKKRTTLKITGTGEMCSSDGSSWCDYGWIENEKGKLVWEMQNKQHEHAGGAAKNQRVSEAITLDPGTYFLKYKSDGGHAFNSWDDLPPDDMDWGIWVGVGR